MKEELKRLLENLQTLVNANALEIEMEACMQDEEAEIETIEDLNEYLEDSMSYWE